MSSFGQNRKRRSGNSTQTAHSRRSRSGRRTRRLQIQTLAQRWLMAADWSNPSDAADVNDDDRVSALDALMIINHLNTTEASGEPIGELTAPGLGREFYPDVNADGNVTALDALTVINRIASGEEIEAPAPDLSITQIDVFPDPVGEVTTGLTSFEVEIQNEGDDFVGQTSIITRVSVLGTSFQQSTTTLLRPDETLDESLLVIDSRAGELPNGIYDVLFEVDPDDAVDETDESNNSITVLDGLRVTDGTVEFSFGGFQDMMPVEPPTEPPTTPDSLLDFEGIRRFEVGDNINLDLVADNLTVTISTPEPGIVRFSALGLSADAPLNEDLEISVMGDGNVFVFEDLVIPEHLEIDAFGRGNQVTFTNVLVGHNLELDAGGEGNAVVFDLVSVAEDMEIDLRGGNHSVRLIGVQIGDDFEFDGSGGSDQILIEGNTQIADDVDIETNGGADFLLIQDTAIGDDLEVDLDDGADRMIVDGLLVGDDFDVDLDDGDDEAWVSNLTVGDEIELDGEDGFDVLARDLTTISAGDDIDVEDVEDAIPRGDRASIDEVIAALFGGSPILA